MWRILAALVLSMSVLVSGPAPSDARASVSSADDRIGRGDCALLGRAYVEGRGCSRDRCLRGARMVVPGRGAEVCGLPRQGGHAFGAPLDYRRCAALHRRWIGEVNWCAANPDRSRTVIAHAPQCTGSASTYLTHTDDEDGGYDECLTPAVVRVYRRLARESGSSLEREALWRSPVLCSYRPRHLVVDGVCVPGSAPDDTPGGVLLVGDSIAWRGTDELGRLRPDFVLDGIPARRPAALQDRLDRFRLDHGQPDGLIVELGTNASPGFRQSGLRSVIRSLPESTLVMLVLPYRANSHAPPAIQPSSTRYAGWMRRLAADRGHTCVADWRREVAERPDLLVDGVHPTSVAEDYWARWISRAWSGC